MKLRFRPLNEQEARTILGWQYEPPYDVYNMGDGHDDPELLAAALDYFLNPALAFHSIMSEETGTLVAFCSFGLDAQVSGGDYNEPALDIGLGVRPDLTGRGLGASFVQAVVAFACHTFQPPRLRVTIASFNQRAQCVWEKNGFSASSTFVSMMTGMPFIIFTRSV